MFSWFEKQLDPFPADRHGSPPSTIAAFCWHYCKDAWLWLVLMSAISASIAIGEVLLFGFVGQLVDLLNESSTAAFIEGEHTPFLLLCAFVLLTLPILATASSLVMHQTLLGNLPMTARWRMHRRILDQSLSFFSNEFAGRIATKVMQTSLAVREAVTKLLDLLVYVCVYFIMMLILVASADLRLTAPLLIWLITYVGLIWYFVPRLQSVSKRQANARSEMTGRIVDSYTNISTVKLFAHAGREERYARESMDNFLQTVHPQMRLVTLFYILVYTNNCVTILIIGGFGIYLWSGDLLSIGAIATTLALTLRLNGMSQWIMWEVSALFENLGVIHDGMGMLKRPVDVVDRVNAKPLIVDGGAINFKDIQFHYGKKGGIIDSFNLTVQSGEKVGLVGRSGAGKTTLTNLLLRFYDLEGGKIMIDDQDISQVTQDSLRAQIGVVTQDTSLLHRSIRENIIYGRPDASEADIQRTIELAQVSDFLTNLVDQEGRHGLDAEVGERGVKLSGGQRQRIAIARIFLKNSPILILDEATSALDSEIEMAIQENLFNLIRGKTVLAIAHRLSTIAQMDRLIVLDKGKIIENGTHDHLLRQNGLYADLWARQSGGFIGLDKVLNKTA